MRRGDKAKAKAKALAEKETKGICSRSVRPGVNQTLKGFTNMSLSILTQVQQFPQFPEKILKGMHAGNPTPLSIKRSMFARVTDVHRILASGSEVCKKNLVVLESSGGQIVPGSSKASKKIQAYVEKALAE